MRKRDRRGSNLDGRRDAPGGDDQRRDLTARSYSMRSSTADEKARTVEAVLASEDPVRVFDFRSWSVIREILVIDGMRVPEQVPLLDSHDRSSIKKQLGSTRSIRIEDGKLVGVRHFSSVADAQEAFTKIREGHLTDGSVGYQVTGFTDLKPGERTMVGKRAFENTGADVLRISHQWALREDSVTPIGADPAAKVREDIESTTKRAITPEDEPMKRFLAWLKTRGLDHDSLTDAQRTALKADFDAEEARAAAPAPVAAAAPIAAPAAPAAVAGDEKSRADELAKLRLERSITVIAESHGFRGSEFFDCKSVEEAAGKMAQKRAEVEAQRNPSLVIGGALPARINYDQADKARDAFAGALAHQVGFRGAEGGFDKVQKDNPLVGRGIQHAVRRYARLMGVNTEDWSREDVALFALGRFHEMSAEAIRSAANISTASFPSFVMLNAVKKIVAKGFEMGSQTARYQRLVDRQTVPDFKQFSIGGLSTGNLQKTAENVAFPELAKSEGVYNSTVNMWGGTLSLSLQALINDDTSQFDRSLRQAGPIADKTIDRRVFQKLMMGISAAEGTSTWTDNTDSGGSLVYTTQDLMAAARGKLAKIRAAMMNKLGKDGNPLGNMPRFLLVPLTREMEALGIVGQSGPGLQAGEQQGPILRSLEVVGSPWLEAAALTGFSTTSYYLLADPAEVTGLVLSRIAGFEAIQVTPYDAGAVAALAWKLWHPFEADAVYDLVGAKKIFPGIHQGTT